MNYKFKSNNKNQLKILKVIKILQTYKYKK